MNISCFSSTTLEEYAVVLSCCGVFAVDGDAGLGRASSWCGWIPLSEARRQHESAPPQPRHERVPELRARRRIPRLPQGTPCSVLPAVALEASWWNFDSIYPHLNNSNPVLCIIFVEYTLWFLYIFCKGLRLIIWLGWKPRCLAYCGKPCVSSRYLV